MGTGWLNIGSFILGLIAWILPVLNLLNKSKFSIKKKCIFLILSISACALALLMQIINSTYLVTIKDWSAIEDTSECVTYMSSALLGGTFILNAISYMVSTINISKKNNI